MGAEAPPAGGGVQFWDICDLLSFGFYCGRSVWNSPRDSQLPANERAALAKLKLPDLSD
jgi:hypothetical protein